jgi:beta-lactamase regulating signal transducer with metallopeptidase domain
MRKNWIACGSCSKGASETEMTFQLNAVAEISALRIVECLVEGTLVTIFAGLVLRVARRQTSSAKFAVWFSALMAIAALPLLGGSSWSHANAPSGSLSPAITVPASWALYLFSAWAVVAAWFLTGVGRGLWHLHILRKSCVPVDRELLDVRLNETLDRNRGSRQVELCTSDRVQVPTAIGFVKPAVVIPSWVMQELSAEELNQILVHELAHLRRWDDWTNLAQKVVKALFFFHPAVWWIEKQVSLEREMACDDAVLAETASPRAYAECLAHLAEKTLIQRSVALAQAALGRIRQTSLRVAQILDANRPLGTGRAWKAAASMVALFAVVCVWGISRAPRMIAFTSGTNAVASPAIAKSSSNTANARVLPEIPAKLIAAQRPRLPAVQPRLRARGTQRSLPGSEGAFARQFPASESLTGSMLHPAGFRTTQTNVVPVAYSETFLVIVEGDQGFSDQPVFQIQMWRVVVLHPVVNSNSTKIPAKQT